MATNQQVIQDIKRVIGLIRTDIHDLSQEEKNQMVQDTIEHFNHYVSPGWLKYRKSVSSDSDSGAVLEWQDEGAYCYGLNGEKFIDCLGGFGIYTCGHRNPEILDVVKAQLDHQALHSQELIDNPWLLGSPTFGGNPVCCAAALATIQYMLEHDVPGQCRDLSLIHI